MFASPCVGYLGSKIQIRFVQETGLFLMAIAYMLVGPTNYFGGLPSKVWIVTLGLMLLGSTFTLTFVLVTPEIIQSVKLELEEEWEKQHKELGLTER